MFNPLTYICLIDKQFIVQPIHIYLTEQDFIEVRLCRVTGYLLPFRDALHKALPGPPRSKRLRIE